MLMQLSRIGFLVVAQLIACSNCAESRIRPSPGHIPESSLDPSTVMLEESASEGHPSITLEFSCWFHEVHLLQMSEGNSKASWVKLISR